MSRLVPPFVFGSYRRIERFSKRVPGEQGTSRAANCWFQFLGTERLASACGPSSAALGTAIMLIRSLRYGEKDSKPDSQVRCVQPAAPHDYESTPLAENPLAPILAALHPLGTAQPQPELHLEQTCLLPSKLTQSTFKIPGVLKMIPRELCLKAPPQRLSQGWGVKNRKEAHKLLGPAPVSADDRGASGKEQGQGATRGTEGVSPSNIPAKSWARQAESSSKAALSAPAHASPQRMIKKSDCFLLDTSMAFYFQK